MDDFTHGRPSRCLLVALAATVASAGLVAAVAPAAGAVVPAPGRAFDEALAGACAVATVVATAWLWMLVVLVVVEALRGRSAAVVERVPRAVRVVVLAACGVALVAPGGTAAAEPPHPSQALHGLPMPDRATSTAAWAAAAVEASTRDRTRGAEPARAARTHVVRRGDTLWALAAADLSPTADAEDVTRRWHRLHQLNRAVIGDDPDLIHPGQRLHLPPAAHRGDQ